MELIGRNYALKVLVPITIVFFLLPFDSFFVSDNEASLLFGKEAKAKTASRDDKSNVLQKNASWKNEIISAEDELHARSSQKFPMRTAETTLELGAGDVIELNIFEKLALPGGGKDAAGPSTQAPYIRRTDLSGEYTISDQGDLSIPTLGRFEVTQSPPQRLEQDLARAYQVTNGRTADITVRLVSHPPVYVDGLVNQPGVYKYVSGMTVAHAVALASGLVRPAQTDADRESSARQLYQFKNAKIRLEQALVEQSRLLAERDKLPTIAVSPALRKLSGNERAELLISRENELMRQENELRQQKRDASRQSLELYERESKAVHAQMGYMSDHLDRLTRLNSQLSQMKQSGYLRDRKLADVEMEILDLQRKRSDLIAVVADIDRKLFTVRNQISAGDLERSLAIKKRLNDLEVEIAELQMSVELARFTLNQMHKLSALRPPPYLKGKIIYELMLPGQSEGRFISVEETTRLMPGAVLQISRSADNNALTSLPVIDSPDSRWEKVTGEN